MTIPQKKSQQSGNSENVDQKNTDELLYKYYKSQPEWKNGTEEFHDLLKKFAGKGETNVLEIGPGPSNRTSDFLMANTGNLDGLDIDSRAFENTALQRVMIYNGGIFPIKDETYDLVVADYVMEHVEHPEAMLNEILRVLQPEGLFVFRTPNLFHYVNLISMFTPHRFHLFVANRARARSRDSVEPYPVFYRFNSPSAIKRMGNNTGFDILELRLVEKEPSYLKFSKLAFLGGVFYERTVNKAKCLAGLRANIFGVLKKSM